MTKKTETSILMVYGGALKRGEQPVNENDTASEQQAVVESFWQKAEQAVVEGNDEEARAWLEGIVELDDGNVDAWLRLANLIPNARERMQCYARVLELSPGNQQAKVGIRKARRGL